MFLVMPIITYCFHTASAVPEQKISTKPFLNLLLNPTLRLIFMFAKHNHLLLFPQTVESTSVSSTEYSSERMAWWIPNSKTFFKRQQLYIKNK